MLAFWGTVGLLIAAALLFVLPPLLRRPESAPLGEVADRLALAVHREQLAELDAALARGSLSAQEHAEERAQIERRVAEDLPMSSSDAPAAPAERPSTARREALVLGAAVPALALAVYGVLGHPGLMQATAPQAAAAAASAPHTLTPEQMAVMVERLAERLKSNPNDADGWHMLARSYVAFGRYPDAAVAYDKAAALSPRDTQVLVDYADTLALVNGRSLEGRPTELVQAALAIDPNNQKALALAGTAAFNRKDYAAALSHWQRLQKAMPPESDGAKRLVASIAQAQAALAGGGTAVAASTSNVAPTNATANAAPGAAPVAGAEITGEVRVAEALRARLSPGATLYVFARAVEGPRMPLAVSRTAAGSFPFRFVLDDRSAMSPQARLSSQSQVMLGARLSANGSATPSSGDLMGTLGPVKVGARDVVLVIDGVVP
ncbi:c-type cytochrome biogenesis protein CcmI [Ideonella sp. A 288]|uniref:c-type cytochrome biogenesis protein CcmI n=1 Tax=Ideonella sp. A 288 TaxID=1962181 RepID=UPI000B4AF375|nr:c-type cytochrome biogenesis protein CcmI [Ideonella sp. A 288]